ncbi:hypothetical protein MC885_019619 [Smutsia gigantea]|nr:hypothetical protein MC885_019619 [Smutsia gigantea]
MPSGSPRPHSGGRDQQEEVIAAEVHLLQHHVRKLWVWVGQGVHCGLNDTGESCTRILGPQAMKGIDEGRLASAQPACDALLQAGALGGGKQLPEARGGLGDVARLEGSAQGLHLFLGHEDGGLLPRHRWQL